jgi:hypothetical protein
LNFCKFLTIIFKIAIQSKVVAIEDKNLKKLLKRSFKDGKHVSNGYKESTMTIGSSKKLYAK